MTRKNSGRIVQGIGFSKIGGRKKLKIESRFSDKRRERDYPKPQIPGVPAFPDEHQCGNESRDPDTPTKQSVHLVPSRAGAPALVEFGDGIPLGRRRGKTHIAIRRDTLLVQYDLKPAHFFIAKHAVIGIVKQKYAQVVSLKRVL